MTIDSTFKTNQFVLLLYVVVAPNEEGMGLPLWYMLCTYDDGNKYGQLASETTLKIVFQRIRDVGLDKSNLEYNALNNVIMHDQYC